MITIICIFFTMFFYYLAIKNQENAKNVIYNGISKAFLRKKHKKQIVRIEFKIIEKKNDKRENFNDLNQINKTQNISFIKDSHLQYSRIDPNKRFENFLIGSSNKIAFEASLKVSENISHYNPLYIYGGVGLGKSHLLNSIGYEMSKNKKVMFISAERFM